jgi:bifunctional DNA-binding transcriptional regulator/antitoxin component of YhaV-PrlF toxin-antitoxin module
MNVIVDPSGRSELPDALRAQWGLKSGDQIVMEESGKRAIIPRTPLGQRVLNRSAGPAPVHRS